MRAWLIGAGWLACGCNQIYGLDPTTSRAPIDAQFFDAPIDAPFQCPPIGMAPKFQHQVHTLPVVDCLGYSHARANGRAIATCYDEDGSSVVEGQIDGAMNRVSTVEDHAQNAYFEPRIDAGGEEFVRFRYGAATTGHWTLELSQRGASGWIPSAATVPYDKASAVLSGVPQVSNISAGPDRRLLVTESTLADKTRIVEFANTGAGWALHDTSDPTTFPTQVRTPSLTPDGLRLVFASGDTLYYSDRAGLADPFETAKPIEGAPMGVSWPFLDGDCGRLYFAAIGTVFYLLQD